MPGTPMPSAESRDFFGSASPFSSRKMSRVVAAGNVVRNDWRRIHEDTKAMADRLARDLAARGIVIVSGLARGIDAIAHQAAVAVQGRAIGVLGTGVDVCYPKENKKLYEKVLERGAIVSEFPLGTHPAPENFPIRNRIVAGMPVGVVVVEGAQYSGSLITARLAMEFGREVWCSGQHHAGNQLRPEPIN